MAIFSLEEGSKWVKKFDVRILNSFFKTMNSLYITKLDHRTSTVWKKLAENLKNTILSPHAMYFLPQKSQNGQSKIFPGTFTGLFHK